MRPPIIAVTTLALAIALSLGACGRKDKAPPPAPPPVTAPAAPPPAALPPPPAPVADGQPTFPAAGTPYAQARGQLTAQGMAPYIFAAYAPGHPECGYKQARCVFVWTDKAGLASYVIVTTDPGIATVQVIGFATPAEAQALSLAPLNLPPVQPADLAPPPNPYARDSGRVDWTTQRLPSISGPYAAARDKLIAAGFSPIPGKAPACKPPKPPPAPPAPGSPGAVLLPPAPVTATICRPPGAPPEIHGCAMEGVFACQAVWSRDNQVLVVNTQGDPVPGAVDNLYWATPGEAADFRAGRK